MVRSDGVPAATIRMVLTVPGRLAGAAGHRAGIVGQGEIGGLDAVDQPHPQVGMRRVVVDRDAVVGRAGVG